MSGRRALLTVVAGLLVVTLAWFLLLYRPQGNDLEDVRADLETAQSDEQTLRAQLRRLERIDADRPALEAELRRLRAAVPPSPELASLILAAHDLASRSEIDFVSITPAVPTQGERDEMSTIAMGMKIEGGFFKVLDYLNRLEDLERVVVIDSIGVTLKGADGAGEDGGPRVPSGSLVVDLKARAFTTAVVAPASTPTTAPGGTTTTTTGGGR